MDLRRLRALVAVADCGGITAAAEKLGYAQSSLSAQLRSLETDLGAPLLVRTAGGAFLTDQGIRLLPLARQALAIEEQMRRAVSSTRPILRIGALQTLAAQWLPDILAALDRGGAGADAVAEVSLRVASRGPLLADLAAGMLDVVFLFDNGAPAAGPHCVVARDHVLLLASPTHQLNRSEPVRLADLLDTPFLIAEPGCTSQMLVDTVGVDLTGQVPVGMVTGSLSALMRLATHGTGVALLPSLAAFNELEAGDLVSLTVSGATLPQIQVEARWRSDLGPAQRAVRGLVSLARRNPLPAHPCNPVAKRPLGLVAP